MELLLFSGYLGIFTEPGAINCFSIITKVINRVNQSAVENRVLTNLNEYLHNFNYGTLKVMARRFCASVLFITMRDPQVENCLILCFGFFKT